MTHVRNAFLKRREKLVYFSIPCPVSSGHAFPTEIPPQLALPLAVSIRKSSMDMKTVLAFCS